MILLAADESESAPTQLGLQHAVREQLVTSFGQLVQQRVYDARGDPVPWWVREFEDGLAWVSDVVKAITFDRPARSYQFTVPLFRRWLQHRRPYEDLWETAITKVQTEMERDGLL